ncbi:MAG: 50S ribosomal protein L44e [Candidatus Nanoarchaeia archaeon]|nr:50S ribosomal protein L44e [Candidatus Nanoarchaeia archaeon]
MKLAKNQKRYCKTCKKHTDQVVSIAKKRDRGTLKKGSLPRLEKRGRGKAGFGNKGKYSRKAKSGWKRSGAKPSKKFDLRFKCKVCNKSSVARKPVIIAKKLELI